MKPERDDQARYGQDQHVAPLERLDSRAWVADREQGDRERAEGGDGTGRSGVGERVHGRGPQGRRRKCRLTAPDHQGDDGPDRHPDRQPDQRCRGAGQRPASPAERRRTDRPRRSGADSRRSTTPSDPVLAGQKERAEEHEDQGEGACGRLVEPHLELVVDLRGQRLVAEDLERAELGQHDEPDENGPTENGHLRLSHGDGPEGSHPTHPQTARHLLLCRIGRSETGGDGEEHERVDGEGHHEDCSPEPSERGKQGPPAETDHEVRDPEGNHHEHGEQATERQIGPLDEPGGQGAHDHAQEGHHDEERHRVPHERGREIAEQDLSKLDPSDLDGLEDEEPQRGHDEQ